MRIHIVTLVKMRSSKACRGWGSHEVAWGHMMLRSHEMKIGHTKRLVNRGSVRFTEFTKGHRKSSEVGAGAVGLICMNYFRIRIQDLDILHSDPSNFLTLRSNISAKTKNFAKPLLPVHMGLGGIF